MLEREVARLAYCVPLSIALPITSDQRACYCDPARFAEAHNMLDDMEARLGFDVLVPRTLLGSKIKTLLVTYPNLSEISTGGNCTALSHPIDGPAVATVGYLLITEVYDALAPNDSAEFVNVGVYMHAGDDDVETKSETIRLDDLPAWIESNWSVPA
jgi:hypothetical protein